MLYLKDIFKSFIRGRRVTVPEFDIEYPTINLSDIRHAGKFIEFYIPKKAKKLSLLLDYIPNL